jgi:prepilin-type N-terminal cleavage/methylation domain-containing protein
MFKQIGKRIGAQRGFTLLEMATVTAIMAALAAIVGVAVTGTATAARSSTKDGDVKNVDTAVARYESDFSNFPLLSGLSKPTQAVAGSGVSGVVKLVINTGVADFATGTLPSGAGVVTCADTGTSTAAIGSAVAKCRAGIEFNVLVPSYIKSEPNHAVENAKEEGQTDVQFDGIKGTADFTVDECTADGETCEFYFADNGGFGDANVSGPGPYTPYTVPAGALKVWNVDSNNNIVLLKGSTQYGK